VRVRASLIPASESAIFQRKIPASSQNSSFHGKVQLYAGMDLIFNQFRCTAKSRSSTNKAAEKKGSLAKLNIFGSCIRAHGQSDHLVCIVEIFSRRGLFLKELNLVSVMKEGRKDLIVNVAVLHFSLRSHPPPTDVSAY